MIDVCKKRTDLRLNYEQKYAFNVQNDFNNEIKVSNSTI